MRRWRLFASAGIAGALVAGLAGAAGAGGATHTDWPQYLYSPGHASANTAAKVITPANAAGLALAWKFVPDKAPVAGLMGFLSSPTVYNGVIYIGAKNGYFYALDETRSGHLEAVHRLCPAPDLRGAGLHGHGHGGHRPGDGESDDLRLRRDRVPVRDERGGRDRCVASGGGRPAVHHGQRLLRLELAAGLQRQRLRGDQLPVRRAACARRPGRVQPGQRRPQENVLYNA